MIIDKLTIDIVPGKNGIMGCSAYIEMAYTKINDTFWAKNIRFEGGKVYALVGEYGQGSVYAAYLTGGAISCDIAEVLVNGKAADRTSLEAMSWCIEPSKTRYEGITVEKAAAKGGVELNRLIENFHLTAGRTDRKLSLLSGERWRASMAAGYAMGRKIFYAPYEKSSFYASVPFLKESFEHLKSEGCTVLLPVCSDIVVRELADECMTVDYYLDRKEYLKKK